jgi:uncharacterized protein YlbG (UPF0298 family)
MSEEKAEQTTEEWIDEEANDLVGYFRDQDGHWKRCVVEAKDCLWKAYNRGTDDGFEQGKAGVEVFEYTDVEGVKEGKEEKEDSNESSSHSNKDFFMEDAMEIWFRTKADEVVDIIAKQNTSHSDIDVNGVKDILIDSYRFGVRGVRNAYRFGIRNERKRFSEEKAESSNASSLFFAESISKLDINDIEKVELNPLAANIKLLKVSREKKDIEEFFIIAITISNHTSYIIEPIEEEFDDFEEGTFRRDFKYFLGEEEPDVLDIYMVGKNLARVGYERDGVYINFWAERKPGAKPDHNPIYNFGYIGSYLSKNQKFRGYYISPSRLEETKDRLDIIETIDNISKCMIKRIEDAPVITFIPWFIPNTWRVIFEDTSNTLHYLDVRKLFSPNNPYKCTRITPLSFTPAKNFAESIFWPINLDQK